MEEKLSFWSKTKSELQTHQTVLWPDTELIFSLTLEVLRVVFAVSEIREFFGSPFAFLDVFIGDDRERFWVLILFVQPKDSMSNMVFLKNVR